MNPITNPIPVSSLIPIDMSKLQITKLPEGTTESLLADFASPPLPPGGADNDPRNLYATIQQNGKTIATLYRSGAMETPNSVQLPADLVSGGANIADARIEQMLAMYPGSSVTYAQTRGQNTSANAATLFAAQLAGQR